ncbi:MAG: threonylcarbamoyl-AMP synthase [Rhodobacteraceae bacterium]|nr:threonylcarbamoyl-AMP synthase [Paracoccaceae bacterium]
MDDLETLQLAANPADLARAVKILRADGLVAFPTETVYGLGGNACSGRAVTKIYTAKGRPSFNPLIVHVPDVKVAKRYVIWSELAEQLSMVFWPGPLTLVLPLRSDHGISSLVTAGLDTLAIRIPLHPAAQALLHAFDGPLAAPSANVSGRISPTTTAHVLAGLEGQIAAILDDGPCAVGLESTIVGLSGFPTLLRPGGLATDRIETELGYALRRTDNNAPLSAPGQLLSHYAPAATVRLNADIARDGEVLLGFGPMICDLNLSPSGDLTQAAANLFDYLHQLDATGKPIAVASVPNTGLGVAINDRIRRAAAPRD